MDISIKTLVYIWRHSYSFTWGKTVRSVCIPVTAAPCYCFLLYASLLNHAIKTKLSIDVHMLCPASRNAHWNHSHRVTISYSPTIPKNTSSLVTWSREMSHLSKISISVFLHHILITLKFIILMQAPLQLDIWLQSYEGFDNAKNNIKQRNLNTVFANISKTTFPTSTQFFSIMWHLLKYISTQDVWRSHVFQVLMLKMRNHPNFGTK